MIFLGKGRKRISAGLAKKRGRWNATPALLPEKRAGCKAEAGFTGFSEKKAAGLVSCLPTYTYCSLLTGRSIDVHFPRYDATKQEDREEFRSVLWALQRQLPVAEEPLLAEQRWEMLYARSIGCIGLLKLHLIRALALALSQEARPLTEAHLRATALPEDRVKEMLSAALSGEADLAEPEGADERLLALLGLREPATATKAKETASGTEQDHPTASPGSLGRRPGDRAPGRDPIGTHADAEQPGGDEGRERAVG